MKSHERQRALLRHAGRLQLYGTPPLERTLLITMTGNEYQEQAMKTTVPMKFEDGLALAALGITGESGEIADLVKKYLFHGHQLEYTELAKEIGDALWYLAYLANLLHIPLEDIMHINLDKLAERYPNGFNHEASLNRKEYQEGGDDQ
jgi:NTP pyrophosphatase (non-canonical NTP hydrolase)